MDREPEELQFLGLAGVFAASARLIAPSRRLFSQITAALIAPIALLFLAHIELSHLLFRKIHADERALHRSPNSSSPHLAALLSSDWTLFLLFKALYLLLLLVFSLLSTSAVVYSVAALFSAKDPVPFSKLFTVIVPKVWRRLISTFLWAFLLLLAYHIAFVFILATLTILLTLLLGRSGAGFTLAVVVLLCVAYLAGLIWISVVWHLASVVSVLEDACGVAALRKSRNLIRGKARLASAIFFLLNLVIGGIELGFRILVVQGGRVGLGAAARTGLGVALWSLLTLLILLSLVVQTVVYFVCKSYHHESIDKSSLADHLEVYHGEYVPLKGKDVQLEHFYA